MAYSFVKKFAVLTLLGALGFLGPAMFVPVARPASFSLFGRILSPAGWGFTSTTVTSPGPDLIAQPGETVTMTLKSADAVTHNFGVDYNDDGVRQANEPLSLNFGSAGTTFQFTARTTLGTYTYICFIHESPMIGHFVIASPPTANPVQISVPKNEFAVILLTGSDPQGRPLVFSILTGPANGSLSTVTSLGSSISRVTYTPSLNYIGPDSFTFKANNGLFDSPVGQALIIVQNPDTTGLGGGSHVVFR